MFQPEVKLHFVRRYCSPAMGWKVFVDIDASEEGRTGSERTTLQAQERQRQMVEGGSRVREGLRQLGVTVGGNRQEWFEAQGLPRIQGDRDIVAFHPQRKLCLIAEVEGTSSGQPEQKLYKAIGQIVMAASLDPLNDWTHRFVLVVHGEEITRHVRRARALERLGISAVSLDRDQACDHWLFGEPLLVGNAAL